MIFQEDIIKLLLPRAMKTRAELMRATPIFIIIVVVHRSFDPDLVCKVLYKKSVLLQRPRANVRPEKGQAFVTDTWSTRKEKQSACCQDFL